MSEPVIGSGVPLVGFPSLPSWHVARVVPSLHSVPISYPAVRLPLLSYSGTQARRSSGLSVIVNPVPGSTPSGSEVVVVVASVVVVSAEVEVVSPGVVVVVAAVVAVVVSKMGLWNDEVNTGRNESTPVWPIAWRALALSVTPGS